MKSTIERLAELAKAVHAKAKHVDRLNPAFAHEFVKSGWVVREDDYTQALDACNPTAIQQCAAEFAAMRKRADSAEAKSAELIAQMQEMVRIAAAKHRPAYDEQQRVIMGLRSQIEAAERREQVLREALNNARAQVVAWQGEPHEYSCTIHKAVVSQIDEALAQSQEVRNG